MESIARFVVRRLQKLNLTTLRKLGRILGGVAYHLARKRRRIALNNLDLAYGESLSRKEKVRIAKSSFINLITTALEFCACPGFDRPMSELMRVINPEVLHRTHAEGKGTILLIPHMGNWEVSARWFAENGYQTHAVMRRQKQPWATRIISEIRAFNGVREIDKRNGLRAVLAAIRHREIVLMLIDQHASKESVEVEFFGHPAKTVASPALIARRTGCRVLVGCCFRYPDGSFGGVFSEPLETHVTENKEEDFLRNTQCYVSAIESFVRQYPQDWMWMHRRWR